MATTRLSGLISGMDTESIISQLVEAKQVKVDNVKKEQTKLEWKQTIWKSLNTKIQSLQNKYISNMRFTTSYAKKTTSVSNSNAVSVITGDKAVNGVQSLKIKQLAKTGYLTGAGLSTDGSYTALSKLSDLTEGTDEDGNDTTFTGSGTFTIKTKDSSVDVNVNADTTISDVLTKLQEAGLNASFDEKNQRFFVSSKSSGADNDFSITAQDANGAKALSAMGLQVNISNDKASLNEYKTYSDFYVDGDKAATIANMSDLITADVDKKKADYLEQYKAAKSSYDSAAEKEATIEEKYTSKGETLLSSEEYQSQIDEGNTRLSEIEEELKKDTLTEDEKTALNTEKTSLTDSNKLLEEKLADAKSMEALEKTKQDSQDKIADIENYITVTDDGSGNLTAAENGTVLTDASSENYYSKAEFANSVVNNTLSLGTGATKVNGQNAIIELNEATFENNTNVFEINGLTYTALQTTKDDEAISVTTQDDTDGIYDMVRNYIKEYDSLINEMDKLYNADDASDYEPLTDDEKDAMSDTEIETYEQKIKDSLLRRDDTLHTVSQTLKETMASGIKVGDKTLYLSNFGINTLSYFSAADDERNAYHIDGDENDDSTSGNTDVLRTMIANDPDTVISFFSQLSQKLYSAMSAQSKSVDGYRTFGSFYDDKKMASDYDDYTDRIDDLEDELNDYEDKWYSKFSSMETAMAKMQSNSSAVTSLLG